MFYLSVLNDVQGDTDIDYKPAYSIYTKSSSCNLSRTIVYTWPDLKPVVSIWEGVDRSRTNGVTEEERRSQK